MSSSTEWPVRVATTLAAWLVAFVVVTSLLTLFGDELGSLPPALRALVISGVLVTLMVNLVMPILGQALRQRIQRK
jgi:antibiotic biosynthesis monooxygenase (ABM) superfamily enzyme